jgi:hypothetical protein
LLRVERNPAIFWAACCTSAMGITKQYRRAGRLMGVKQRNLGGSIG